MARLSLYPTIATLAGAPAPVDRESPTPLDGTDLAAAVADPPRGAALKRAAYSIIPRAFQDPLYVRPGNPFNLSSICPPDWEGFMGYSVRVAGWRYTAWMPWLGHARRADWSAPAAAVELYAHDAARCARDFDACETANVAAKERPTVERLHAMLRRRFDVKARYVYGTSTLL